MSAAADVKFEDDDSFKDAITIPSAFAAIVPVDSSVPAAAAVALSLVERKAPRIAVPAAGRRGEIEEDIAFLIECNRSVTLSVVLEHVRRYMIHAYERDYFDAHIDEFAKIVTGVFERRARTSAAAPAAAAAAAAPSASGGDAKGLDKLSFARSVYLAESEWPVYTPSVTVEPFRGPSDDSVMERVSALPLRPQAPIEIDVLYPEMYLPTRPPIDGHAYLWAPILCAVKQRSADPIVWYDMASDLLPPLRSGIRWAAVRFRPSQGPFQWAQLVDGSLWIHFINGEYHNPPIVWQKMYLITRPWF